MPGAATAHLRRAAALTLAVMWACEMARLLAGSRAAVGIGIAAFVAYFALGVALSRFSQRWVVLAIAAAALAAALHFAVPQALVTGASSAVLFAAFLAAMQMLRVALEGNPVVAQAREHVSALPAGERHDSVALRTHLLASVLGAGGLAAVSPLLPQGSPPERRREFAESALQGFGLVVLWSPFFVAMGVSTRLSRDSSLGLGVLSGVGMALLGLVLSHLLYGGRLGRAWIQPLGRTLVESAVLATAIILANRIWGIGNLEAVAIGIPLLASWLARREIFRAADQVARRWLASLATIAVEALVVGVAMVLGEVVKELLARGLLAIPAGLEAWPVPLLIALPAAAMLGSSLLGLHPIVSASLLLPVLASIAKLHSLVATGSVLLGWMLCVVLSTFVVPVLYAASLFEVRPGELARGRNLRFCLAFAPLAIGYLWALNEILATWNGA